MYGRNSNLIGNSSGERSDRYRFVHVTLDGNKYFVHTPSRLYKANPKAHKIYC